MEELEHPHDHSAELAAHEEPAGGGDPMHHIMDKVLIGIDKTTGKVFWKPNGDHGHPVEVLRLATRKSVIRYEPALVGPFKLEFTKHMANVGLIAIVVFVVSILVARRVLSNLQADKAPRGPLANAIEALIAYVRDEVVEPVGGHHLTRYTPLFLTYFFFILFGNLMGMIPEFGGATGNVNVTIALGGSVYALVWFLGIANQGPINFILHMVPPGTPWWMWLPMLGLELMGPLVKCFVLCVRLFANMIAGHLIISNVLGLGIFGAGALMPPVIAGVLLLFGLPLALGISILEILVCFIQAYVFTLLAVVFIGAAVHPEH